MGFGSRVWCKACLDLRLKVFRVQPSSPKPSPDTSEVRHAFFVLAFTTGLREGGAFEPVVLRFGGRLGCRFRTWAEKFGLQGVGLRGVRVWGLVNQTPPAPSPHPPMYTPKRPLNLGMFPLILAVLNRECNRGTRIPIKIC